MSQDGITVGKWVVPESDIEERFETSGGPGGQHANRTKSEVIIRFDIAASSLPAEVRQKLEARLGSTVVATAADSRSQWRNRAIARKRLAARLEGGLAEAPERRATRPSKAAKQRRMNEKRARSEKKRWRRRPSADE